MMQSENINELVTALSKAQGEITNAAKDSLNPHFKSKYADLSSIWEACRAPLSKNGLAVIQTMENLNNQLTIITTLAHSSGQWMKSQLPVLTATNTPQALGSAITYMRRYSLAAITGVAPGDDDDAEAAMTPNLTIKKKEKPTIGSEKAQKLGEALETCDPKYIKTVWDFLSKNNMNRLEDLSIELYDKIYAAALKNQTDYAQGASNAG